MFRSKEQQRRSGVTLQSVSAWGCVGLISGFLLLVLLLPSGGVPRFVSNRYECRNNLRILGIAMYSYHDKYHSFPPAYIVDKNGRPMHSWRVLLLPFLELDSLYKQYRFDEAWNGPHNRLLAAQTPDVYHCPADAGTDVSYFVVVGPRTVFPGAKPIRIRDITDGTSSTILLVEATDSRINWLQPRDMSYAEAVRGINPKLGWGISSRHEKRRGAEVAFADGSVPFLSDDTSPEQLRRMLECDDGLPVSASWEP